MSLAKRVFPTVGIGRRQQPNATKQGCFPKLQLIWSEASWRVECTSVRLQYCVSMNKGVNGLVNGLHLCSLFLSFFCNQLPFKALYNIALTFTHSCTHSHTDGGVSHARRQPAIDLDELVIEWARAESKANPDLTMVFPWQSQQSCKHRGAPASLFHPD